MKDAHRVHIKHISRTPSMAACTGSPSTTLNLPCILETITVLFSTALAGITSFVPVIGGATGILGDALLQVPLAIRNLPWKVVGPVF